MDTMKTKSAFQEAFFTYWNDLRYYLVRTANRPVMLMDYASNTFVRLLCPFLPFSTEQINKDMGSSSVLSTSSYPVPEDSRTHPEAEIEELAIQNLIADFQKIMKVLPSTPKNLHVYVAPVWENDLLSDAIESRLRKEKTAETLQRFFSKRPEIPKKDVANVLAKITNVINDMGEDLARLFVSHRGKVNELGAYQESKSYLESAIGVEITFHPFDEINKYDPKGKSGFALPFKPALYLE